MSYDDDDRAQLERAGSLLEAAAMLVDAAGQAVKRVHERHPLYYRANAITRDVDELSQQLRRDAKQ